MKKKKPFIRLFAMILAAMLIVLNGYNARSLTVSAATTDQFEQVKKVLPTGTTLKSDTFPGLRILFDGKESYTIEEGRNNVELSIEVTDAALAKKSVSTLSFVFGQITLDTRVGAITKARGTVSGIQEGKYKALVSVLGYKNLTGFLLQLTNKDSSAFTDSLLTSFLTTLTNANEYEAFIEAVEAAVVAAVAERSTYTPSRAVPEQALAGTGESKSNKKPISRPDRPDPKEKEEKKGQEEGKGEGEEENNPEEDDEYDSYRTIMIFLNGCDLETKSNCATKNLLDLLSAPMPENTRIFITTGGTEKWHMNDLDAFKKYARERLYPALSENDINKAENISKKNEVEALAADYYEKYKIEIGQNIQIYEVKKGEVNTLSLLKQESDRYFLERAYLTEYIDYVLDNTNSETYDLIIWDHGGGIEGFGNDEIYNKDLNEQKTEKRDDVGFTNIELVRKAIADSQLVKEGGKFDFIGFDTCQMATVEVATTLQTLAKYLIVSEENEPGNGWDYNKWMAALNEQPKMSAVDLGSSIVDTFVAQYANNKDMNATLSLIDTSKMQAIDQKLAVFAQYLVRDFLTEEYHDSILETIGKTGDYGAKYGYNRQGLLDVVHLCTPFLDDGKGKWTQELMDASASLSNAISDAVVKSNSTTGINDNGLSINVPLNVVSRSYAGKNQNGDELYYTNFGADDVLAVYNNIGVNSDYKKAYAQMALNKLAAVIIGDSWVYDDYAMADVINVMNGNDEYRSKRIREAAETNLTAQSDPVRESIEQLLAKRVSADNITVASGVNCYGEQDPNVGAITISNINPVVVDELVNVNVVLKTGENSEIELGLTPTYTTDFYNPTQDSKAWTIKPFDNRWYVINDQISDFVVTSYDTVDMTYKGYIRLGVWDNWEEVEGDSSVSRDEYIADKIKNNKLSEIQLNVEGTIDYDTGLTNSLYATNFCYTYDGAPSVIENKLDDIENCYLEILGGSGSLTNSLGTIQASVDNNNPDAGYIRLGMQTIIDLKPAYYFTDSYGVEYELSDAGLKNASDANKAKSLDNFVNAIPEGTETLTFAQSQEKADAIRKKATADSKASQNSQTISAGDTATKSNDKAAVDADVGDEGKADEEVANEESAANDEDSALLDAGVSADNEQMSDAVVSEEAAADATDGDSIPVTADATAEEEAPVTTTVTIGDEIPAAIDSADSSEIASDPTENAPTEDTQATAESTGYGDTPDHDCEAEPEDTSEEQSNEDGIEQD